MAGTTPTETHWVGRWPLALALDPGLARSPVQLSWSALFAIPPMAPEHYPLRYSELVGELKQKQSPRVQKNHPENHHLLVMLSTDMRNVILFPPDRKGRQLSGFLNHLIRASCQ